MPGDCTFIICHQPTSTRGEANISLLAYNCIHNDFLKFREIDMPLLLGSALLPNMSLVTMEVNGTVAAAASASVASTSAGTNTTLTTSSHAAIPDWRKHDIARTQEQESDCSTKKGFQTKQRMCLVKQAPNCSKRTDQICRACNKRCCKKCANYACPERFHQDDMDDTVAV